MTRPGEHVSSQWAQWRERIDLEQYEARFAHATAHGEADFLVSLDPVPASVLDAGCGTGRLGAELGRRGVDVVGVDLDDDLLAFARRKSPDLGWVHADLATFDLGRTFDVVVMAGNVLLFCKPEVRSDIVARCAAHLAPRGVLVAGFSTDGVGHPMPVDEYDRYALTAGLALVERFATWDRDPFAGGSYAVSIHRPA